MLNGASGYPTPNYRQFPNSYNSQGLEEKSNISNDEFKQLKARVFGSSVATQMININRNRNIMDSCISFSNRYGSSHFVNYIAEVPRQSGFTCHSDGSNYEYNGNNPAEAIKRLIQIEQLLMTGMQIINLCYIMTFLEMVGDDEFNRIVTQQIMSQHSGTFNLSPYTVLELPCPKYEFFNFDIPSKHLEYSSEYLNRNNILPGDYVVMSYDSDQMLYEHPPLIMKYHLMCVGYNELDQPLFIGASGENTPNLIEEIWGRFHAEVKTRSDAIYRRIKCTQANGRRKESDQYLATNFPKQNTPANPKSETPVDSDEIKQSSITTNKNFNAIRPSTSTIINPQNNLESKPIQSTSRNNQQHKTIQGGFVNNKSAISEYNTDPDTICEVNLDEIIEQYDKNRDVMAQIALNSKIKERIDNATVMVFKFEALRFKYNMLNSFIAYGLDKIYFGKNYEKKIYFVHNDLGALHQFLTQSIENESIYTLNTKKGYCEILNELQAFSNR